MAGILDFFQPQANAAAVSATDAALEQAAARPFNVIISVSEGTQLWIAGMLLAVAVFHLVKK